MLWVELAEIGFSLTLAGMTMGMRMYLPLMADRGLPPQGSVIKINARALQMTRATQHRHVVTDDEILNGEPIINGTRTPVRAIVEFWRSGMPPEEIPSHLPRLNMAQIFDALSYYSENQDEINS